MSTKHEKAAIDRGDPANPPYADYGKELVNSALYGTLLAGGGAALYHLINGARNAELPSAQLLANNVPNFVKTPSAEGWFNFGAGEEKPKRLAKKKQRALPAPEANAEKSASGLLTNIYDAIGRVIPSQFIPDIPTPGDPGLESPTIAHRGWRTAANYAAAIGGGMGGLALVKHVAEKKRKEDLDEEVNAARQEYFDALTGKTAAEIDVAYEKYAAPEPTDPPPVWSITSPSTWWAGAQHTANTARDGLERGGEMLWTAALLSALGTGAIGAKYMYDQTKARTSAENLRRAAASKARLQSINQTPWVDPEALVAVSGR